MATDCFSGFPAFTSVEIFFSNDFFEVPFLSGMITSYFFFFAVLGTSLATTTEGFFAFTAGALAFTEGAFAFTAFFAFLMTIEISNLFKC